MGGGFACEPARVFSSGRSLWSSGGRRGAAAKSRVRPREIPSGARSGLPAAPLQPLDVIRGPIGAHLPKVSPLAQLAPRFPPCLLVHGVIDGLVPLASSRKFMEALARTRPCESDLLIEVPGAKHAFEHGGGALVDVVNDGIVAWLQGID